MVGERIDEKEVSEWKKICKYYIEKRKRIMDTTIFKVEDILGNVISKDILSPEQITKLNVFLAKMM